MAPFLDDPRLRNRWNRISSNAESIAEIAATNIWTFQHKYMNPCFSSVCSSVEQCVGICFSNREERARRRTRGRAEASFDFYDDWDQDDNSRNHGLFGGWGNEELGKLLAGNGSHTNRAECVNPPSGRKRAMSYGTRGRRTSLEHDPTVIPSTSALGFLCRLPFKFGGTLRYKPSAADLQDQSSKSRTDRSYQYETESLITDRNNDLPRKKYKKHKRSRSSTSSSAQTSNSFRSRRDLLPSDEEEDAVPLSDEFTIVVEQRTTSSGLDEEKRQKTDDKCERPSSSRNSTIVSPIPQSPSRSIHLLLEHNTPPLDSHCEAAKIFSPTTAQTLSLLDLKQEEHSLRLGEGTELDNRRQEISILPDEGDIYVGQFCSKPIIEDIPDDVMFITENTGKQKTIAINYDIESNLKQKRNSQEFSVINKSKYKNEASRQIFVPARLPNFY
ncbi:hypothetical protein GcM3_219009 [Golovinomyces cichoracearum]|uniref:Uncharacterized protein n=1 Tax=Golovinomyces cichoracearum TaxID=62708 RepID=A0A420H7E4_9PEZI|nr:hypothetical protein GcM3_219009 [Golovinomyces cichoracearum]